ncbi:MAG TPA: PAS domain S-box protein [Myxococcales bacterium]
MELTTLLEVACHELCEVLGAPDAAALLLDDARTRLSVVAEHLSPGARSLQGESVAAGAGGPLAVELAALRDPFLIPDASDASDVRVRGARALLERLGNSSIAAFPLLVNGETAGVLSAHFAPPGPPSLDALHQGVWVARDVERELSRIRLGATRRRLLAAIDQTPESVVITGRDGRIVYVNAAFERITGYPRALALGENPRVLKSGRHDAAFYEEMWATLTRGEVWRGRLVNRRRDGSLFTEDAVIAPVRDEAGTLVEYIAVKRDVTAELEVEERLVQAHQLEGMGRLAGAVAGEFNNTLAAMAAHVDLALLELPAGHRAREDVAALQELVRGAGLLSRQLLSWAGRSASEPRNVDLGACLRELSGMARPLLGQSVTLALSLAGEMAPVRVAPGALEQVLLALVLNARDAMPAGGTVTVRTAVSEVGAAEARAEGIAPGRWAAVSVSDTGVGTGGEVQRRVFEPFFAARPPGRASGLALAASFGVVRKAGGAVRIASEKGQGTTVTVLLPFESPAAAPASGARGLPELEQLPGGTETVLLVDDEAVVRGALRRVLKSCGYRVLEAKNVDEALLALREAQAGNGGGAGHGDGGGGGEVPLVITDVMMPGPSGVQLASRLLAGSAPVKVILMSGFGNEQPSEEMLRDVRVKFLQKPFNASVLAKTVRELLDGPAGRGSD